MWAHLSSVEQTLASTVRDYPLSVHMNKIDKVFLSVILDASPSCNDLSFSFGGASSTRQYDIKVTQYNCGGVNLGGEEFEVLSSSIYSKMISTQAILAVCSISREPRGQWQGITSKIMKSMRRVYATVWFLFPVTTFPSQQLLWDQPVSSPILLHDWLILVLSIIMLLFLATHLSNQCYTICFRRETGQCGICFSPVTTIAIGAAAAQSSFGLRYSQFPLALRC